MRPWAEYVAGCAIGVGLVAAVAWLVGCAYSPPCSQENTCTTGQVCAPSGHCEPATMSWDPVWRCEGSQSWPAPKCVRVR